MVVAQRQRRAVERDVSRVMGLVRSGNKGLLIRRLEFQLRAGAFSGEHCGILICILEELLQLHGEG